MFLVPTQLHSDIAPLSSRHAVNGLKTVNNKRREQKNYNSTNIPNATRSGKNDTSKSGKVHSLGTSLLADSQSVSVLIHNVDTSASLLETHEVHISSTSTSHSEPRNALHLNSEEKDNLA
jgi:hypothetical protein